MRLLPVSQTYLVALRFMKSPTLVALTFVWWISLIRQVFQTSDVGETLSGSRR
ncbi:hypothetical protein [Lentzea terrae]|uniref:hypothetical protein n=1 Tax=Lentzea terrae TaxID=2200761 RepID=UPI0013002C7B|nr:hypothetical protein [Lentzea terrae]